MKKITIIAALTLLFAMSGLAEHVRPDAAQKAAKTFLNVNLAQPTQISLVEFADRASFPNLYVYGNDHCFVIMAADDRVQPVLGYSLTSNFGTESLPDNVRDWLQGYNDEIQYAIENQTRAAAETTQLWQDLMAGNGDAVHATLVVAPLIQTKWNQNKYYNSLCPLASGGPDGHAYTGCVATSMAQIMKYYNYPSTGIGSHSYNSNGQTISANFGETTYDWNNMSLYYEYYYDDNSNLHWLSEPTSVQITAVATLMYHCGVSVDMNYSGSGSGASLNDAATALKTYFNYNPGIELKHKDDYEDAQWKTMVKNELNAGRPLQYRGQDPNGGGHAFVCDGYNNSDYFHFNWGWAGHYDGYFSLSNMNSGNGVYINDQAALFGIRPSNNNAIPTNLTYTQNGMEVTLSWNVANGAASYNIYRNDVMIGNTTTCTFTDSAFGTNLYYVRSVDANGELSLASNIVTVTVDYSAPVVDDLQASVSGHNVNLTWTAPEWCYPESPTASISYGDGDTYYSWSYTYYAHRYLAADLAQYANKAVYKVSTYVQYPGTYSAYVYVGTTDNGQPNSSGLAMSKLNIDVQSIGWYDFDADSPIILSGTQDLWVVMKQENTGQSYPTPSYNLTQHNTNAFYGGSSPTYLYDANSNYNCAWRIKAYVTDGTYTYNIYRNNTNIANNVSNTTYTDSNLANGNYTYFVKTNYYGGETVASNQVTVDIGNTSYYTITATANPTAGGMVTSSGIYQQDQICTLTATANDGFTFDNWTKDGQVVSTNPAYSFTVTENAAFVANFTNTQSPQTTTLPEGWTWWSTYIETTGNDVLEQLEESLGSNGMTIKSQNGFVQYSPEYNIWYGSNGFAIDNESCYMIQASTPCQVVISGSQANPADHPITLATGWNWIGYPNDTHLSFETAFSGITPADDDQVKSQGHGFASYMDDYSVWFGNLTDYGIDPGMGLMYKSNNSNSFSFTYPSSRGDEPAASIGNDGHWSANYHAYPNNMTLTAVVELDDVELTSENYELAAFASGECRGSAKLMFMAPLNRYVAFLTIAGDEDSELRFNLYDAETGTVETECSATLQYETNAVVGNLETPYVVRFRSTTGVDEWASRINVYPNPVARGAWFSLGITADEIGKVRVEIVNTLGAVLSSVTSTKLPASFRAPETSGVYTLCITVEGKGTCYRKLVVR